MRYMDPEVQSFQALNVGFYQLVKEVLSRVILKDSLNLVSQENCVFGLVSRGFQVVFLRYYTLS